MKIGPIGYSKDIGGQTEWRKCGDLYFSSGENRAYVHLFCFPVIQRVLACKANKDIEHPPFLQGSLIFSRPEIGDIPVGMITSSDNHEGVMYSIAIELVPVSPNNTWMLSLEVKE